MPPPPPQRIADQVAENLSDWRTDKKGFIINRLTVFAYDVSIIGVRSVDVK
jgi:hypothetical protein